MGMNKTQKAIEKAIASNPLVAAYETRAAENFAPGLETVAKTTIRDYPLGEVTLVTGLNPRMDFDIASLRKSLASEGQREPISLYHLSGEALKFAQTFNKDVNEKSLVAVRGERRCRAMRANRDEWAQLKPGTDNPFETIRGEFRGTISTRKALVVEYHDNIARLNLNLRCEQARSVKQFIDAGHKLESIAQYFGNSIGWVQTRLNVANLPNTAEIPLRDMVEKYDITKARIARAEASKDAMDDIIKLSDKGVRELERAWRWKSTGGWKLGKKESQPGDFDELFTETVKTKGANFDADESEKPIARKDIVALLPELSGNAHPKFRDAMLTVVNVILGNSPKDALATFYGKGEAPEKSK